ncbi:GTP pyrophosphokinase family protein [Lactobacillus intestinalis]|uniref:GTP pyrophosphokinase family protein n=1 Tax=Lactobacillus intestinalis TaxID=151781 RepID=A0A4S2BQ50_9LACO|nr:GTP pyrophosphokinase YwaC [Lactobacillus intestinalis]TGY16513.1 GTP pyrophosphokinase family protein [Lactobacillus intestinalis]
MLNIYGDFEPTLHEILDNLMTRINDLNTDYQNQYHESLFEHLNGRIKSQDSMKQKCQKKNLPLTPYSALRENRDSIGIRIVCNFIDDIYTCIDLLEQMSDIQVIKKKDYITNAKANGYRSYHLILAKTVDGPDVDGNRPGLFYVEVQLRTIAIDTWASLEHEMKYKHNIKNPELIGKELKRVADELASCDVSMQTIRQLIREEN